MNFPLPFPCYLSNESRGEKAKERERARERSLSIERGNGVVNNASPGRAKIKRLKIRICWRVRLGRMFRIAAGASNLAHPFQTSRTSLPLLGCRPYLGRSTLYKRIEPPPSLPHIAYQIYIMPFHGILEYSNFARFLQALFNYYLTPSKLEIESFVWGMCKYKM